MNFFAWKPEYAVGCPEIDLQHKQLFRMAGELQDAMVNGRTVEIVEQLLDRLVSYTRHHFDSEERLMRETGYPDYAEHHDLHDKLAQQVLDFQARFRSNTVSMTLEMMRLLRDWLEYHIRGADAKLGAHVLAYGWKRSGDVAGQEHERIGEPVLS